MSNAAMRPATAELLRRDTLRVLRSLFEPYEGPDGMIDPSKAEPRTPRWYLVVAARAAFWSIHATTFRERLCQMREAWEWFERLRTLSSVDAADTWRAYAELAPEVQQLRDALRMSESIFCDDLSDAVKPTFRKKV